MQSLQTTSGDLETTSQFGTWKQLPGTECGRVVRGYSNCWKLWRVAGEARNMTENDLSILIVIFFVQLQQTVPSDRKLCISNVDKNDPFWNKTRTMLFGMLQEQSFWEQNKNDPFWNETRTILFGT